MEQLVLDLTNPQVCMSAPVWPQPHTLHMMSPCSSASAAALVHLCDMGALLSVHLWPARVEPSDECRSLSKLLALHSSPLVRGPTCADPGVP